MANDKKELNEIVDIINVFIKILDNFFSKLASGQIFAAKEMQITLKTILKNLRALHTKYMKTLAKHDLVLSLQEEITTSTTILNVINSKIDKVLVGLTDEEYHKDPDTYKTLLIDEFSELIKHMKNSLTEIKTKIEVKINELVPKKSRESFIPPDAKIQEEAQYIKFKKKADPKFKDIIKAVENKIISFSETKTLHGKIKTGPWAKYRHARLHDDYDDYRIVYLWNSTNKILTYCTIGRHKELGIG